MKQIKLIKSTFLKEAATKKKLCKFIMDSEVLSMNTECKKFEKAFSEKQGRKYSLFVANGSVANLALIQSMINTGRLKVGDKVFVSSLTWATNVMPIIQLGLVPIVLDVEKKTLNVSSKILRNAYRDNPNAKCLFITNALGFCSDLDKIKSFCNKKNILFLEDNCESLGSEYNESKFGNFGLASTFSFFVGHHISTIEGGMVCTDDENLYENLKLIRSHGWARNSSKDFKEELAKKHSIDGFYDAYTFYDLAYNIRPTEINGFLGNDQLKHWDSIVSKREENFKMFNEEAIKNDKILKLDLGDMTLVSNFAYPLIFKSQKYCEEYKKMFMENKIEIRPIISGDISKQPFFTKYVKGSKENKNAEFIRKNGFYVGNNTEMTKGEINRIRKLLRGYNEKI